MRLAVFQCDCAGLGVEQRLSSLSSVLKDEPADLVVCPELFLSGYNVGDALRRDAVSHRHADAVGALAQAHDTAVIYGYPEAQGDTLHNSAALVSADGRLLANHRKRANSPGSFEEDYFTPGDRLTIVDYRGVRIALLICYEIEFPESARQAAEAGAELIAAPTALVSQWSVVAEKLIPARAFENGVFVAYANHAGEENGFTYLGGSRIVAPDGEELAVAGSDEELIFAEIDLSRVAAAQARLPYLRDARLIRARDTVSKGPI